MGQNVGEGAVKSNLSQHLIDGAVVEGRLVQRPVPAAADLRQRSGVRHDQRITPQELDSVGMG